MLDKYGLEGRLFCLLKAVVFAAYIQCNNFLAHAHYINGIVCQIYKNVGVLLYDATTLRLGG
jgi:hypothetical protein